MAREFKSPIAVLALIGVAAFNIDRIMIYSGLLILIVNDTKRLDINSE